MYSPPSCTSLNMANRSNWQAVVSGGTTPTTTTSLTNSNTTNHLVDFSPQFSSFTFGIIDSNPIQPMQLLNYPSPSPSIPINNPFPNQPPTPPPQPILHPPVLNSSAALPPLHPRPQRYRRKRNQPMMMVQQMTQEELMDDTWTWRKYGQKPIKGSPYPRNYYRCSVSKGCGARKHVERNIYNPTTFMVSYHGQHSHSRPVHRSSVLNNGQNQFFNTHNSILDTSASSNAILPASTNMFIAPSSSTPILASNPSFSTPTNSSMEVGNGSQTQTQAQAQVQQEIIVIEDDDEEMVNVYDHDDDDDDDILIPNMVMAEDILNAFEELRREK